MDDSLKYGIPGGLISFAAVFMLSESGISAWLRLFVCAFVILVIALLSIRLKNQAYFPFSFAFLSGFNITIVMVIVHSALLALFGADIFPPAPDQEVAIRWLMFYVFQEAIAFLFVAMLVLLIASVTFMRRKPS